MPLQVLSQNSNGNGKSNPAVKNARNCQIEWEKENGFDPDEDWRKDGTFKEGWTKISSNIHFNSISMFLPKRIQCSII